MNVFHSRSSVLASVAVAFVTLGLFMVSGCRTVTQPAPTPPGPPTSLPSAAITGMIPLDCNGNSGDFEVDLFVCDTSGHFIPNLLPSAITILGSLDTLFTQSNVDTMFSDLFGNYSAELLLDQTGSIRTTDPLNLRLIAAKLFLQATNFLAVPNEVQLSTFQDSLENGVYMQSYGAFTHNTGAFIDTVALFATRVGGGTPLYDAMYNEIDSLANQAHNTNKVLVVFTDGEDNESGLYYPGANLLSVIHHAAQENVKIFAIALQT
ncbi:MAG TPA: VWA domain-containing protein, partial [Candidatus Kapabacteria bacterium]